MQLQNVILDGFNSLKDGSVKIRLVTRELSPKQLADIVCNLNKEITTLEIPDQIGESKSSSQRLRSVIYKLWESQSNEFKKKYEDSFELYYKSYMEKIINLVKEKI